MGGGGGWKECNWLIVMFVKTGPQSAVLKGRHWGGRGKPSQVQALRQEGSLDRLGRWASSKGK